MIGTEIPTMVTRKAKRILDAYENKPKLAADALFHLNRMAKKEDNHILRMAIYDAKNALVRHFYERGFAVAVEPHKQVFTCWNCGGSGEDEWGCCDRCGGSGVYREVLLYKFVFVVEGQRYVWHQPRELVTFPVTLTEDDVSEYDMAREPAETTDDHYARRKLYLVLIAEYLRCNGVLVRGFNHPVAEAS